jgi:7-keto-8-aminopelargonate synthetase-like enzyme
MSKYFRLVQNQQIRRLSTLDNFKSHIGEQLKGIKAAGTFKNERIITTKQAAHIKVANSDADILNFCANNYLGLSRYNFI